MRSGSGRVVRVWTGSASDGLIRGVVWNGRDLSGRVLLAGTYHWALTGTGPFGAPLDTVGVGVARGLVRVT